MKKTSKSRLLFLAKHIKENTDIDNPLSTTELIDINIRQISDAKVQDLYRVNF